MASNLYDSFKITSVARADLEDAGFEASEIENATMKQLAEKMADAYVENSFWVDLPIVAEQLGIPKRK